MRVEEGGGALQSRRAGAAARRHAASHLARTHKHADTLRGGALRHAGEPACGSRPVTHAHVMAAGQSPPLQIKDT